jgi:polysaccharide pyruvyl transferase WcaK-like protein
MGVIKKLEIIIAMRLHSLIYAATQGIPMVGIAYDPKIVGFLKSIDMEYMCSVENMDYNQLIKNVQYVWDNKEELRNKLIETDKEMKNRALKNVHMALELLKK